jgi:hypothetical protein
MGLLEIVNVDNITENLLIAKMVTADILRMNNIDCLVKIGCGDSNYKLARDKTDGSKFNTITYSKVQFNGTKNWKNIFVYNEDSDSIYTVSSKYIDYHKDLSCEFSAFYTCIVIEEIAHLFQVINGDRHKYGMHDSGFLKWYKWVWINYGEYIYDKFEYRN